jgi:hypothetical protein
VAANFLVIRAVPSTAMRVLAMLGVLLASFVIWLVAATVLVTTTR